MMKKAISAVLLGGALASGGCVGAMIGGDSGPMTTKTSSESGFTSIDLQGSADLFVNIGSEESIKIEGNETRVNNVTTSVVDGVLVIDEKSEGLFGHAKGDLKITVTAPSLEAVSLSGSGDIEVTGASGESFKVELYGSGDIEVKGEVGEAHLAIYGSGDISAKELVSKDTSVKINGSGDADVFASESVSATIQGSGDITYFGGADDVSKTIEGSGNVSASE